LEQSEIASERPVAGTGPSEVRHSRRRSDHTETKILDAARELLADIGVQQLTIEAVAARSGVAKTTIYRRWRSKEDLALAVLLSMTEQVVEVPELEDARSELIAFVSRAVDILSSTLMGRVVGGLVSDLATDPALGEAFRDRVIALRLSELDHLVRRGVERGELRNDVDVELLHELLFGPVYHRLLLTGGDLDATFAEQIVDALVPGLSP
jgi:AcrR family transcriptional regulator